MLYYFFKQPRLSQFRLRSAVVIAPVNNVIINNDVAPSHRLRRMDSMSSIEISKVSNSGRSILKYRSIAIPLNTGIELLQVSQYFDISNIEPALLEQ